MAQTSYQMKNKILCTTEAEVASLCRITKGLNDKTRHCFTFLGVLIVFMVPMIFRCLLVLGSSKNHWIVKVDKTKQKNISYRRETLGKREIIPFIFS
jgi:hypothetical protein